jgi:hypothetical protein
MKERVVVVSDRRKTFLLSENGQRRKGGHVALILRKPKDTFDTRAYQSICLIHPSIKQIVKFEWEMRQRLSVGGRAPTWHPQTKIEKRGCTPDA